MKKMILSVCSVVVMSFVHAQTISSLVLKADAYKHYVDRFNTMENENVKQAIPNDSAWEWMKANIPLFECPQKDFEELFYYRWWTFRKHIEKTPQGYAITEFLVPRTYADKYNLISSALGHHIYESRWLHDKKYMDDNLHIWYRGNDGKPLKKLHFYSSWNIDAIYNRFLVNGDTAFITNMLPDLEADFKGWEQEKKLANGLYWQYDVRDAMEETISGGRKEKNARPSINAYMYGNAQALRQIEFLAQKPDEVIDSSGKTLIQLLESINEKLWNQQQQFFEVRKEQGDTLSNVKEEIGFIPWYFRGTWGEKDVAWKNLTNIKTFCAPYGITTADRSHPQFRTHGCCKCEWDGAVWPFATSQTLTALANLLNYSKQKWVTKKDYLNQLQTLAKSQYVNGKPYIGEYLDEKTGVWLKGEERSRYYNHSTFNDLIITGLVGLRPAAGSSLTINPLLPENTWDWFCLDNILYHGKIITIIWDKTGNKYHKGKGLSVWVNGKKMASSSQLKKITGNI